MITIADLKAQLIHAEDTWAESEEDWMNTINRGRYSAIYNAYMKAAADWKVVIEIRAEIKELENTMQSAQTNKELGVQNMIDFNKVEDIVLDGVCMDDYPDFCDAYVSSASMNGEPLTELELEKLNDLDECMMYVNVNAFESLLN